MPGSHTTSSYLIGLVIVHGVLGIALFGLNLVLYPPWVSLFYWWLAPFDIMGFLATILLALKPVRVWGGLLGIVTGGLECVALLYLAAMMPTGASWPPLAIALVAACRLAAVWLVTRMEAGERAVLPKRGCVA